MRSVAELATGDSATGATSPTVGRTVCVTVHQPSAPVFALVTRVLLLAAGGRTVFFGAPADVVPYFTTLGYEFEAGANPADFAVTVSGGGLLAEGAQQPASASELAAAWRAAAADPLNPFVARQVLVPTPARPQPPRPGAAAVDAPLQELLSGQSLSDFPPQDRQVALPPCLARSRSLYLSMQPLPGFDKAPPQFNFPPPPPFSACLV
jgi:hypothetical protein